ncbi:MAG: HAMP domain-containing protein, partial [Nitrospinaceae bacterium]
MKKLFKSTIFTQLLFYFFPIALLPLLVILSLTYFQSKKTLQTEKLTYLRTILTRHAEHIESYINERHGAVKTLSQMPSLMNALVEFNHVFQKGGTASPEYISIDRQLRPFMTTYKETYGYEDLFLISRDGDVIFSVMHREELGTNLQRGPYRKMELAGVFLKAVTLLETEISKFDYYPPARKPAGFMAAPVFHQGRFAGVVALQMNMRELAKVVNDVTGLGKTGETVVAARVGHEALFMAPSRFDPDAAFKRKVILDSPLAMPIQEAVNKKQGSGVAHDYRNREVLAAWKYLPSIRWGMVIKMDASEAFQPISTFRDLLIYVGLATILLVIGVTLFAAKTFSRPIAKLQSMTRRIAAGELNEKIEIPARNEIGQLAESFNTMTAELNRYHHQMEELVAQRTEELKTVNELLRRESAFLQLQKDIAVAANENQP